MSASDDLGEAVLTFFTNTDPLPKCPPGDAPRLWWEERDGWLLPWRIVGYEDGVAQGYPCGEPKKKE